jgi:hypothetical protein
MRRRYLAFAGLGLATMAVPAFATEPAAPPALTPMLAPMAPDSGSPPPFHAVSVVSDDVLSGAAAKANLSMIDQTAAVHNTSTVADNSINGDFTTGVVSIASDAFAGTTGLTLFNINTGNNVAINASMNVNVAIQP